MLFLTPTLIETAISGASNTYLIGTALFLWLLILLPAGALYTANSPWLRYLVATGMLAGRNQLPFREARFLDWAHDVGLMRLSGISIQFRHLELQSHLVSSLDSAKVNLSSSFHA